MKEWKTSSAGERSELLDRLLGKALPKSERAAITKCLDEASDVPGHAELEIREIVEVCKSSDTVGQPV